MLILGYTTAQIFFYTSQSSFIITIVFIKVYGNRRISNGMFCAGDLQHGGPDACQGDSGGPAVAAINGRYTLLGKLICYLRIV